MRWSITYPWITFEDAALIGYPKRYARRIDEDRQMLQLGEYGVDSGMLERLHALSRARREHVEAEMFWKTYMVREEK